MEKKAKEIGEKVVAATEEKVQKSKEVMKELGEKIDEHSKEAIEKGKELAAKAEVEINKGVEAAK